MTPKNFIDEVQSYYNGKYTPGQIKFISIWLNKKKDSALPLIMAELFKQYSGRFKVLPGIAEFEEAAQEVKGHRMHEIPQSTPLLPDEGVATPEQMDEFFAMVRRLGGKEDEI